jgi:hypothetical protein
MGVISSAIQGMPLSGSADMDTCGPNFSTIHDFKVGDVFERHSLEWEMDPNGIVLYSKTIRKSKVVSLQKTGNAMAYDISGIEVRIHGFWKGGETRSAGNFQERLEYIDSGSNFLNKCKGEIVSADISGTDANRTKTKIQVASGISEHFPLAGDSASLKWIGGEELGTYGDDGTLIGRISDGTFKAVYAKGLGLVDLSSGGGLFPFTDEVKLTGYIKNGRTVGIITPDHLLADVSAIRNKRNENFEIGFENGNGSRTKVGTGDRFDILGREPSLRKVGERSFLVLKRP